MVSPRGQFSEAKPLATPESEREALLRFRRHLHHGTEGRGQELRAQHKPRQMLRLHDNFPQTCSRFPFPRDESRKVAKSPEDRQRRKSKGSDKKRKDHFLRELPFLRVIKPDTCPGLVASAACGGSTTGLEGQGPLSPLIAHETGKGH